MFVILFEVSPTSSPSRIEKSIEKASQGAVRWRFFV